MSFTLKGISIAGITACLPPKTLSVKDMAGDFAACDIERIIASSGVKAVRIADDKTCASDLCVCAAEHLINAASIDRSSIDAIVFISQTPDYKLPATSVIMQNRLGLESDVMAFDINYGCSGYIYGLLQAGILIASGACLRVLVCAGDTISKIVYPKDRSTRVLMGDAGSATLVERGDGKIPFHFYTNGAGAKYLYIPAGGSRIPYSKETCSEKTDESGNTRTLNDLHMDGMEIMHFALKHVPASVDEVLAEAKMTKEEIDVFLFHQPNQLILNYLRKKLKIVSESMPIALENTGNTSPASIPLAISLKYKEILNHRNLNKVLLSGFGSGLSVASAIVDLSKTMILEPVEYRPKLEG